MEWKNQPEFPEKGAVPFAKVCAQSFASHHIRCLLDEVFGEAMFRSEIIWHHGIEAQSLRTA